MTDDQTGSDADDRAKQAKPEQPDRQAEPSQANAEPEPRQRGAPGRRPLFGT